MYARSGRLKVREVFGMKHWIVTVSCIAVLCGCALGTVYAYSVIYVVGIVLVCGYVLARRFRPTHVDWQVHCAAVVSFSVAFFLGYQWQMQLHSLHAHTITGEVVVSAVHRGPRNATMTLDWEVADAFSRTYLEQDKALLLGTTYLAQCAVEPLQAEVLFDWAHASWASGVQGQCQEFTILGSANSTGWSWFQVKVRLLQSRQAVLQRLADFFHSIDTAWLAQGLLVGDKSQWTPEFNQLFQRVGLSHIVALSGWNVTFFIGVMLVCFARAHVPMKWAVILGMTIVWLFVAFTGASSSLLRAAVMGSIGFAARLLTRPQTAGRLLLLATAVLVLLHPASLWWDVSFHLSVLATFALVAGGWGFMEQWEMAWWEVEQTARASVAVTLVTLPYVVWQFGTVSLVAIPLNILVLPIIPIATAAAALGWLMTYVPIDIPYLETATSLPLGVIIQLAHWAALLPWANVSWESVF